MKCILHIGTEKTGTSLLQEWLYTNRAALSAQRVFLSNILGEGNNIYIPLYFRNEIDLWMLRNQIDSLEKKESVFGHLKHDFRREIEEAKLSHDVCIITSEHLHSRITDKNEIKNIYNFLQSIFDDVEVICYFRNQFDVAVSLYSTALKVDALYSLDDFLQGIGPHEYYYNYLAIANNWVSVFGKEKCHLRIYDQNAFVGQDIRKDFMALCISCFDMSVLDNSITRSNKSLSPIEAAVYRSVNKYVPERNRVTNRQNLANEKIKLEIDKIHPLKKGKIISQKRREINQRFSEINTEFFRLYFEGENGFDQVGMDQECKVNSMSEPRFSVMEVADMMEKTLHAIFDVVKNSCMIDDEDALRLRNTAIKIENQEILSISDALELMKIASRVRPAGPIINQKMMEYQKILDQKI